MKTANNTTLNKVRGEIARLERQIELDKVRLQILKDLLPSDVKISQKPEGFVLTASIKEVLSNDPGKFLTQEDIYSRIAVKWAGYQPNRKSLAITLGVWVKEKKLEKGISLSGAPGYRWQ